MLTSADSQITLTDSHELAVVGAGTAGCLVASVLAEAGCKVCIVEKSRGVGGRASRRRLAGGAVDLGAAGFCSEPLVRSPQQGPLWQKRLDGWLDQQWITRWTYSVASLGEKYETGIEQQLCGVPNMNFLHRHLTKSIPVVTSSRVVKLDRQEGEWLLIGDENRIITKANKVILTLPAKQVSELYCWPQNWSKFINLVGSRSRAQFVAVLHFKSGQLHLADVYRGNHPVLSQAIRDSGKPLRRHQGEYWVLQSTFDWADEHIGIKPDSAAALMTQAFLQSVGKTGDPEIVSSHRWLLAQHENSGESPGYLWSPQLEIGLCGDWFQGGGIAGALMSGQQLVNEQFIHSRFEGEIA